MLANLNRPQRFSEVVGQDSIISNIREQSRSGKYFSTYVFSGQFGSGKTTVARILAKTANCTNKGADGEPCGECEWCKNFQSLPDYYEVDGASNNGVDKVRELIDNVSYVPVSGKYKIYIIDEVHMLSVGAFNALLKTLEEPPAHVIFILATTEVRKIPATILSRAAVYNFQQISAEDISNRLLQSDIPLSCGAAQLIARQSSGAMRNAWSILEQAAAGGREVTEEVVRELLVLNSSENTFDVLTGIKNCDAAAIAVGMEAIIQGGNSLLSLLEDMEDALKDAILLSAGVNVKGGELYSELLERFIIGSDMSELCFFADGVMAIKKDFRSGMTNEGVIVRCISLAEKYCKSDSALIKRIDELEKRLSVLEEGVNKGHIETGELLKERVEPEPETNAPLESNSEKETLDGDDAERMPQEDVMAQPEIVPDEQMDFGLDDLEFFFFGEDDAAKSQEKKEEMAEPTYAAEQENNGIAASFTGTLYNDIGGASALQSESEQKDENAALKNLTVSSEQDLRKAELDLAEAMTKDALLDQCIKSCAEKVIQDNVLVIKTPYKAVKKIIDKCLDVYSVEAKVELVRY